MIAMALSYRMLSSNTVVKTDRKNKQTCYVVFIKTYEYIYEQSAIRPVQFIIKKNVFPQIHFSPHLTLHTNQLFLI